MSTKKDAIAFINELIENSQKIYNPLFNEQDILFRIQKEKSRKVECEKEIIHLQEDLAEIRFRKRLAKEAKELLKDMV